MVASGDTDEGAGIKLSCWHEDVWNRQFRSQGFCLTETVDTLAAIGCVVAINRSRVVPD